MIRILKTRAYRLAAACLALLLAATAPARPQDSTQAGRPSTLRVFLDCHTRCDFDYFRTEITFVDHVRDRQVADVHVIITSQETGGGGEQFNLRFIGLKAYAGVDDELTFSSRQTDTDDEVRNGLTRTLKLGLVRYAARSPAGQHLEVTYQAPENVPGTGQQVHDPWNYWVFRMRVSGFLSGETSSNSRSLNGSLSARRTTERQKLQFSVFGNSNRSSYDLDSVTTFVSNSKSYEAEALGVWSLNGHWSAGFLSKTESSSRRNLDLLTRLGPALEFDFFKYSESTRRQLTLLWTVGYSYTNYTERTLYGKTTEGLFDNDLQLSASFQQPWGSVEGSLEGHAYLHDLSKNRLELFTGLDIRLLKGLSMNLFGSYSRVHDQLFLPAAGATPEEILLQLKQLQTSYQYHVSLGLSFTFGSIFNNVVNPRFDAAF